MWQAWRPHNQADVDAALALLLDLSDNFPKTSVTQCRILPD